MANKIDHFIQQNRLSFDSEEPSVDLWNKIEDKLSVSSQPKESFRWLSWQMVASVVAIVGIASLLLLSLLRNNSRQIEIASETNNESVEAALFYESQITDKQKIVFELTADQPLLKNGVTQDLAQLDSLMLQIKRDLNDDVSNEKVIEAMIQNYRLKLAILEEVLQYVKPQDQSSKTESHEL